MPSELVNSVISSPHPPSPRITRRKSVSVTPAIGANTAAGRIIKSRILNDAGIIRLSALLRRRILSLQEFAAEGAAVGGPFRLAGIERERGADSGEFGIEIVEIMERERLADHRQLRR